MGDEYWILSNDSFVWMVLLSCCYFSFSSSSYSSSSYLLIFFLCNYLKFTMNFSSVHNVEVCKEWIKCILNWRFLLYFVQLLLLHLKVFVLLESGNKSIETLLWKSSYAPTVMQGDDFFLRNFIISLSKRATIKISTRSAKLQHVRSGTGIRGNLTLLMRLPHV